MNISADEARKLAEEAYIFGFPLVDSYRVQHAYFVDILHSEFKAAWNQLRNVPRVYTANDRALQSPNCDTPYSWLGLDLRAEPMVLTVPRIDPDRYFSIQLIDAYTFNFDYIGSRTTGNDGGSFLVAGPGWSGGVPDGIQKVFRSETELAIAMYRTQLFAPDDLDNVKQVQAGYRVQPLSAFLGEPAPEHAPAIDFIEPPTQETVQTSLAFFNVLNFVLQFCPTHPSETALMARLARIGVGAGKPFDADALSPQLREALAAGMAHAWESERELERQLHTGALAARDILGSRAHLGDRYHYRMLAAKVGLYGNSMEEALYPVYAADAEGKPLDASARRYTLRFAPGELPPVHAFWSLTLYEARSRLFTPNPLDRYLLNSPMLSQFRRDADGGITFVIQCEAPASADMPNWLPAPDGPFLLALRLFSPKAEALDGRWMQPPLRSTPRSLVQSA